MIIPNISYSNEGGLSVGATLWYGIPGLSADASVSYNFKTESANLSAGGNVGAFRGSVGYDSKGGWNAGVSISAIPLDMTIGSGFALNSNITVLGVSWSQNGGWSANVSSFSFSKQGVVFDPSVGLSYSQELKYTPFAVKEKAFIDYHKPGLIEAYGQEVWDNVTIKFESIEELGLTYYSEEIGTNGMGYKKWKSGMWIHKKVVRQHWRGKNIPGRNTIYHEFQHASDNFSAMTDFLYKTAKLTAQKYPQAVGESMCELRAYNSTYKRFGTSGLNHNDVKNIQMHIRILHEY